MTVRSKMKNNNFANKKQDEKEPYENQPQDELKQFNKE